jgi:signal transduction protein with GAF and PtsI domain
VDTDDLTRSVAAARALFGAAACSCALVDADDERLVFTAADGEGADKIVGVELPIGRGIAGWAVMSGQPIAVRDVGADARFARDVAEQTTYVPTSVLAAPMFDHEGEVIGVLEVLDPAVDEASDWLLAVLGTLAAQTAMLVEAGRRAGSGSAPSRLETLGREVLAAVAAYERGSHA